MALTLLTLNFLNLPQGNIIMRAGKHFASPQETSLLNLQVWAKIWDRWVPTSLQTIGKGYASVIPDGSSKTFWVSLHHIRHRDTDDTKQQDYTPRNCSQNYGIIFETSEEKTMDDITQSTNIGTNQAPSNKGEQVLHSTRSPLTPEKFLALVTMVTSASLSAEHIHWAYILHPPLLETMDWAKPGPVIFTNDSWNMPSPWSKDVQPSLQRKGDLLMSL